MLTRATEESMRVFERKVLRRVFGPVWENGFWHMRYNNELYQVFSEPDIVKIIKIGGLRGAVHVVRMVDDNSIKKTHPPKTK
jgi:hypothetical protein